MSPEQIARSNQRTDEMTKEMLLAQLRYQAQMTQMELAERLGVKQPTLSNWESQDDMQISTLRRIVEALGGELEIIAKLPDQTVTLSQFVRATEPSPKKRQSA